MSFIKKPDTAGTADDSSKLGGNLANTYAPLVSPSFTTPTLGVATGTSLNVSSVLTVSPTSTGGTGSPSYDKFLGYNPVYGVDTGIHFGNEFGGNSGTWLQLRTTTTVGASQINMTLSSNGFAGFGTLLPAQPVVMERALAATTFDAGQMLRINGYTGVGKISGIGFGWPASTTYKPPVFIGVVATAYNTYTLADFIIATRALETDTDPIERVRVTGDGNVGIGMPTAPHRLTVKSPSGVTTPAGFHTNDWVVSNTGSSLYFQFGAASGNTYSSLLALSAGDGSWDNLVLQSGGGNVGIGTVTPTNRLSIGAGGSASSLTAGAFSHLTLDETTAGTSLAFNIETSSPFTASIQHRHLLYAGYTYPIALNPLGGNIGFGTANPFAKTHIKYTDYANSVVEMLRLSYSNSVQSGGTISWWVDENATKTSDITGGLDASVVGYTAISGYDAGYHEIARFLGSGKVQLNATLDSKTRNTLNAANGLSQIEENIKDWVISAPTVILTITPGNGYTMAYVEIYTGGVNAGVSVTSTIDRYFIQGVGTSWTVTRDGASQQYLGVASVVTDATSATAITFTLDKFYLASAYYANVQTKVRIMSAGGATATTISY